MQRVRIGLTGLAFVFVAVLLAAALTSEPSGETEITPNLIERERNHVAAPGPAPAPVSGPTEPLAEMGVAPGNPDSNESRPPATAR